MLMTIIGRCYQLDRRPMHLDEAVHAIKFIDLLENGSYKYDPHEYHGPTLYYFSLPVAWLRGETTAVELSETTLRFVSILASALFFIPLLFMGKITKGHTPVAAALAVAISPIVFYYSRYYIHEIFLVGFLFAFIISAWRYTIHHKWGWALTAGAFLGLALATKETITIAITAIAIAFIITTLTEPDLRVRLRTRTNWRHVLIALVALLAVLILFYSSFFTNFSGIADFFRSHFNFLNRAGGQGHARPWNYYLKLMVYFKDRPGFSATEVYFILPALATGIIAFTGNIKDELTRSFSKFLFIYSLTLIIIYSCIPYKMPWLALNWMQPITVLTGIGITLLLSKLTNKNVVLAVPGQEPRAKPEVYPTQPQAPSCTALAEDGQHYTWNLTTLQTKLLRLIVISACLLSIWHLGYQIYRENGRFMCDSRNPYVYSHTGTDFLRLPKMIKSVAAIDPSKTSIPIMVISDEYWPLPWYLREFNSVGYWYTVPEQPLNAPLIITSISVSTELYKTLQSEYVHGIYGLRSGVILVAFVRNDLWKLYLEQKAQ